MNIIFAFLILVCLGVILSLGLSFAQKKFADKKDSKLIELESVMPGANCGGCGFAGCADYAKAVYEGTAKPGLCSPGGQAVADKMGSIMGIEVGKVEKRYAYVFCCDDCSMAINDFDYKGISDCNAAALLFNGSKGCKSGCLHLLSCQKVCDSNAIYVENNQVRVDREKCVGCGRCVSVCPHNVIKLVPADQIYAVKCNNHSKGADVNKVCKGGCIGCKICEVKHPESGIKVLDNLAVIDSHVNNDEVAAAAETCPKKIIVKIN